MSKHVVLTGITTTGTPHLGNYVGAIRPAIEASVLPDNTSFFFLADWHSLIKCQDPSQIHTSTLEIAATWLALGLDTSRVTFYRQSDVPEIAELMWLLSCMTAKGLLNRAHAYKAAVQENEQAGEDADPDKGVTLGLFSYPVLMAADILMFGATKVPVGRDQIQHVEMARDIAHRFNHHYGEHFVVPQAVVDDNVAVLQGLDGRKMSKSYQNTIPLFMTSKDLRKLIMKIKTNSLEPGVPKETEGCTLFQIYRAFATEEQAAEVRLRYDNGIAWGEMKQFLFEYLDNQLTPARIRYHALLEDPALVEAMLREGGEKARAIAKPFMAQLRAAVGIQPLG